MSARFDSEPIESGEQTLVPGVRPVTTRDRLEWKMTQPKAGSRAQKPCDLGMFDANARNQLHLIDLIRATQKKDT
jgi:hypothetical protein